MKEYKNLIKIGSGILLVGGVAFNLIKIKKLEKKTGRSFLLQSEVNKELLNEIMENRDEIISVYDHIEALCQEFLD